MSAAIAATRAASSVDREESRRLVPGSTPLVNRGAETPVTLHQHKAAQQTSPLNVLPLPATDRGGEDITSMVRQTAQSLMQRWARGEADDGVVRSAPPSHPLASGLLSSTAVSPPRAARAVSPRGGTTDTAAPRVPSYDAPYMGAHHRAAADVATFIPPRWEAALNHSVTTVDGLVRHPQATATITIIQPGGNTPLTWNVVVRPELLRPADNGATPFRPVAPLRDNDKQSSPPPSSADTYGLSEAELRYFGLSADQNEQSKRRHHATPKELLMAHLRTPMGAMPQQTGPSSAVTAERPTTTIDAQQSAGSGVIVGLPRPSVVIRSTQLVQRNPSPDHLNTSLSSLDDQRTDARTQRGNRSPTNRSPTNRSPTPSRPTFDDEAVHLTAAAAAAATSPLSPSRQRGRSFLNASETPLNERFKRRGHCDATNVQSLMHMHALTKVIMSEKASNAAGRHRHDLITSIDCSGTRLARQAKFAIPTSFTREGQPIWAPRRSAMRKKRPAPNEDGDDDLNNSHSSASSLADIGFWPDEQVALRKQRIVGATMSFDEVLATQVVLNHVAERSLSLGYLAPLLFLRGGTRCRVTTLVANRCDLNDADAAGLAAILRCPALNEVNGTNFECHLTHVDLSENSITDDGAVSLKKAIKYNTILVELLLRQNPISNGGGVLNDIKKRLRNNRKGVSNLGIVAKLLH